MVSRYRRLLEPQTEKTRTFPHHIIINRLGIQIKERILKAAREKHQVTYKG
jgi:hypothetical protein